MAGYPRSGLQLRSIIRAAGELELSLAEVATVVPTGEDVLVRVEASPINPSDLTLLLGAADLSTARISGTAERPVLTAEMPPGLMGAMADRIDQSRPVGNEGAGLVVAAGPAPAAQALVGRRVAMMGGAMYAEYRCARASDVLPLPDGITAAEGASCFVNPLTALAMVEAMRCEGHAALVHTAAASSLGQMLNRICLQDHIELVNIVRRAEQVKILTRMGATHVVDSTSASFMDDLAAELAMTHATVAFDAVGGGMLASQILFAMQQAADSRAAAHGRPGATIQKQVYIYGGLDPRPTELARNYGMAWGIGGWQMRRFLGTIGPAVESRLRRRVVDELKTTFASHYAAEISLCEALQPQVIAAYARCATGGKYLIKPQKGREP